MSIADVLACLQRGDSAGADARLAETLAANPRHAEALHLRALVRHQRGDLNGALNDIEASIAADAKQAAVHFNHGNILLMLNRPETALGAFTRAVELAPNDVQAWLNRAGVERTLRKDEAAAESCARVLQLDPKNTAALNERAAALGRLGRFEEALACIDRALALKPKFAPALANRGKLLAELERYEEACASYDAALAIDGGRGGVWNNLGVALSARGKFEEAAHAYQRASAAPVRDFDAGNPIYNIALMRLLQGDYAAGFPLYAQRFTAGESHRSPIADSAPPWRGERVEGVLRIWSEQGVGDQLLFYRLLPLVLERTPNVIIDCELRLVPLLRRSYPALSDVLPYGASAGQTAVQIALGDLPAALKLSPNALEALPALLSADATKRNARRAEYERLANGRRIVGIAWSSPKAKAARLKGAQLGEWGALLREPYFFVSLQYGEASADIAAARAAFGAGIHEDASVDQMHSIDDFAAQIAALDHVVTVSNTTAHVAGALGAPCVVMAPPARGLHWYWGFNGPRTPWYPSLRLVRRSVGAPWSERVSAAAALLRDGGQ
jgi:Tfp pilus assembly protein PilF